MNIHANLFKFFRNVREMEVIDVRDQNAIYFRHHPEIHALFHPSLLPTKEDFSRFVAIILFTVQRYPIIDIFPDVR